MLGVCCDMPCTSREWGNATALWNVMKRIRPVKQWVTPALCALGHVCTTEAMPSLNGHNTKTFRFSLRAPYNLSECVWCPTAVQTCEHLRKAESNEMNTDCTVLMLKSKKQQVCLVVRSLSKLTTPKEFSGCKYKF